MGILVTDLNVHKMLDDLSIERYIGFDSETFGLGMKDDFFSLQFATNINAYYVNFKEENGVFTWDRSDFLSTIKDILSDTSKTWFIHNAKFDMHRLANYDYRIAGRVHCTQAVERIIYNQHFQYGLDACLKRIGRAKNDLVEKEIKEKKLYTMVQTEAKKTKTKMKHYDQVSFGTMFQYACQDAVDVLHLGLHQLSTIKQMEGYTSVYETETNLTKAAFELERTGMKLDLNYAKEGKIYERKKFSETIASIEKVAGRPYKSGPIWLRTVLDEEGTKYSINPKTGNPIFDKKALAEIDSAITRAIVKARTHEKYATTYYSSFLEKHIGGKIYATIRQDGTDTGRFSYAEPNMQNVPKEEKVTEGFQVRKAFVPEQDHCLVAIDFDQQEFRLMLDYANESKLIRDIMEHGTDVHQATADMVGIERSPAKTLNFGLLYGMGEGKLALALGLPTYIEIIKGKEVLRSKEARGLIEQYFGRLPYVKRLIKSVQDTASKRGYINTWAGRRLHFPNKELCYKAPNHLIQGGCGDIAKQAMVQLVDRLHNCTSKCLIQVHDEFIFQVHKDELDIIPDLRSIMEKIYQPKNGMYLTCGVDHSWVSWGKQDIINGTPTGINI